MLVSVRSIACYFLAWWLTSLGAVAADEGEARDSRGPGRAAVTVAIVPSLKATTPQEVAAAVELVADQLAIELANDRQLRVVDRTQIDHLLQERRISDIRGPVLAYDALIGVRIERRVANPTIILRVVDLSLGNVAGSHEWPWTGAPSAEQLREMARACKESSLRALAGTKGRLKVRLLGVATPGKVYRPQPARPRSAARGTVATPDNVDPLESMADHLGQMIEEVAARVPGISVVQHLEALSSKEESLLLLLGQARLAEGREFAPQADRLLSVELIPKNARGMPLVDDTPLEKDTALEIHFRLSPDGKRGDWVRVQGTVADWSHLASQACQLVAKQLGQVDAATTDKYVTEMILRRRQAEAELEAAMRKLPRGHGEYDRERIAVAMKLDPTYEEAAFTFVNSAPRRYGNVLPIEATPEAFRYLERFHVKPLPERLPWGGVPKNAEEREVVRQRQRRRSVLIMLTNFRADAPPKNPQELEIVRKIVELGMGEDIHEFCPNCGWVVQQMYRGWKTSGVDPEGLRLWLEEIRRRADILTSQMDQVAHADPRSWVEIGLMRVRSTLITAAVESGNAEVAHQRLKEFMACRRWISKDRGLTAKTLRPMVEKMADPTLLAEYDRWLAPLTTPVDQMALRWDDYPVYDGVVSLDNLRQVLPPMEPLAASPAALYGVAWASAFEPRTKDKTSSGRIVVRVPLDAEGRPAGNAAPPPQPEFTGLVARAAVFAAGTLYLATEHSGLWAYDATAEKWRQIPPPQGLSSWRVDGIYPLDEARFLLIAGGVGPTSFSILDVKTNQVKLVRQLSGFFTPSCVGWEGERLTVMGGSGLVRDLLGTPRLSKLWLDVRPDDWSKLWSDVRPDDWPIAHDRVTDAATVLGKHYLRSSAGLHEFDASGNLTHNWWNRQSFSAGSRDPRWLARDSVFTPGNFPTAGRLGDSETEPPRKVGGSFSAGSRDSSRRVRDFIAPPASLPTGRQRRYAGLDRELLAQSKDHLFVASPQDGILCYAPASDTWFGPLVPSSRTSFEWAMGTAEGLWIGGARGAVYIRTADFLDAARAAGRVMTSLQVRQRQRELAEKAGPLAAATFDLSLHDFEGARKRVEVFLASHPTDPQALFLMAVLHDFWCMDRPDQSLAWYRKLAALDSDLSAVYTGTYAELRINYTLGRWEQAIAAGDRLLDEVPCLGGQGVGGISGGMAAVVELFQGYARENRGKDAATAAPDGHLSPKGKAKPARTDNAP